MFKTLRWISLSWIAGWMILSPNPLLGRDWNTASDLYGQGVHAYLAGRSSDAESLLSRAIAINSQDPRLYYFRALSRMRMGRVDAARSDMATGAALEAEAQNQYAVGAALGRVQGGERLMLERYRRAARSQAEETAAERSRLRDEQVAARDPDVVRQRVIVPLDGFLLADGPQPLTAEEAARRWAPPRLIDPAPRPVAAPSPVADDPFRDDAPPPAIEPAPAPPPPAAPEDEDDDPFADF